MTITEFACLSTRNGVPCVLPSVHEDTYHRDEQGNTWFNHGPLQQYEITWMSGHVETVAGHQVTYPHAGIAMSSMFASTGLAADGGSPRVQIHAQVDGHWRLILAAREDDIRTMRNVTGGELLPGGER